MLLTTFIQLLSTCIGVAGSLFFAIGVMRQSVEAMARLAGSYWDWNPHMSKALAVQKADYLFGGGLITLAFVVQLVSFFVSVDTLAFSSKIASWVPWYMAGATVIIFFLLRVAASKVARHYEGQINEWLKHKNRSVQTDT